MRIEIVKYYSHQLVKNNPNKIFVFGDNWIRKGKKGQAIIRDFPNALGIATKKYPSFKKDAYLNDRQFKENCKRIKTDIEKILKKAKEGYTIVFPESGIGTGLADLKRKAPKTWKCLNQLLEKYFGYINGAPASLKVE